MAALVDVDDSYKSFEFDFDTGVASEGIWLCIAQLLSRAKTEIEADFPCQANVDALRELLAGAAGASLLAQNAQPDQVPMVVCPEYAFGSGDWVHVDALVDNYPGPIILIAGFGQCPPAGLKTIQDTAGNRGVTLRCGWNKQPPDNGRPMNLGSVWIKYPNSPRSVILFGKNFLEAKNEDFSGVFKFKELTEIVFKDVRILPFICADAIETPKPGSSATVGQRLAMRVNSNHKPAICVGSLLQPVRQASEQWVNAIDRLIHEFGEAQAVLVISNVATVRFDPRKGGDQWRNLSGVYVSKRKQENGQKQAQESTSYFESATIMAWPLRSNLPQVAFGTVGLPPYTTASGVLHPWNASPKRPRCSIVSGQGDRIREYVRSGLQDELLLLAEVTNIKCGGSDLEFAHVKRRIVGESQEVTSSLVSQLLDGPLVREYKHRVVTNLCNSSRAALASCLACLDAVFEASDQVALGDERFSWAPARSRLGEIMTFGPSQVPVAVWWSVDSLTGELLAEIRIRAHDQVQCAALRIFGRGLDGDFDPDLWREICHETTSAAGGVVLGASEESEYADLLTVEATSIEHVVKPRGLQPLINLVSTRCGRKDKFVASYGRLVRSVQS